MKQSIADIHIDRINDLMYELIELSTGDVKTTINHIKEDCHFLGDEGKEFLLKIGKKPNRANDAIMWLHYGQEKVHDALGYLQQLADELDDIEDEINKDEVNNADGKRMLSLP